MNTKYTPHKRLKRPNNFGTAVECIRWIKKSVYLIVRGRIDPSNPEKIVWCTLGTGCIVAPKRMITAAHVIWDKKDPNPLKQHQHGDRYYLIKHDDENNWHYRVFGPELEKELFLYHEVDLAVIYLEDKFYQDGNNIFLSTDDYIRIDQKFKLIGTDVAVLGYPLCQLDFTDGNILQPNIGNILLRVDSGVINSRYLMSKDVYRYEFTIAFNPGNSGGPIFDWRTGQLISIVHGFRSIPINISEKTLTDEEKTALNIKDYKEKTYIHAQQANYSVGYATPSFIEIFKPHNILN